MEIRPETRFKPSPFLASQIIDGAAVLVSTRDRTVHRLDAVGTALWGSVRASRTFAEAVDGVVEEFDVGRAEAEADAREFLADLAARGLLGGE